MAKDDVFMDLARLYFRLYSGSIERSEEQMVHPGQALAVTVINSSGWSKERYNHVFGTVRNRFLEAYKAALEGKETPEGIFPVKGMNPAEMKTYTEHLKGPEYERLFQKAPGDERTLLDTEFEQRRLRELRRKSPESITPEQEDLLGKKIRWNKQIAYSFYEGLSQQQKVELIEVLIEREWKTKTYSGVQSASAEYRRLSYFPTQDMEPFQLSWPSDESGKPLTIAEIVAKYPNGGQIPDEAIKPRSIPGAPKPDPMFQKTMAMDASRYEKAGVPVPRAADGKPNVHWWNLTKNSDYQPYILPENMFETLEFGGKQYPSITEFLDDVANKTLRKVVAAQRPHTIDPQTMQVGKPKPSVQIPVAYDEFGKPVTLQSRVAAGNYKDLTRPPEGYDPSTMGTYNFGFAYLPESLKTPEGEFKPDLLTRPPDIQSKKPKAEPKRKKDLFELASSNVLYKKSDLWFADPFTKSLLTTFGQAEVPVVERWYDDKLKGYDTEEQLLAANTARWEQESLEDAKKLMVSDLIEEFDTIVEAPEEEPQMGFRAPMSMPPPEALRPEMVQMPLAASSIQKLVALANDLDSAEHCEIADKIDEILEIGG